MLYVFFWVIPRGNYPKENIQHTEHGESLKSRIFLTSLKFYPNFGPLIRNKDDIPLLQDVCVISHGTANVMT